MELLIKNGRVINPVTNMDRIIDILIENNTIKKIGEISISKSVQVIDAKGCWVVPGFIDVHVHLREPGFEYKEDIKSGTESAVTGGFTTVCCMPNTNPVIDRSEVVEYIMNKANDEGFANVIPIGAITISQKGKELADIEKMIASGAKAISEDGRSVLNSKILKEAMYEAKRLGIPVLSHCEDEDLAEGGCMNEGAQSKKLGLQGISNDAEDIITARDIILARTTGSKLHLCHVSTKESVKLIRQAKLEGLSITAEVCPHHFTLTEDVVDGVDTNTKMNPPLRNKKDVDAILKALKDGTLDCIATDHAPHAEIDKNKSYEKAANGIVGFETAFPLAMTELVKKDILKPSELIEKMSVNPAKMMNLDKGSLEEGKIADITIINPDIYYKIDKEKFKTKGRNTPFDGRYVYGRIKMTIVNGSIKYDFNNTKEVKND